MDNAQQVNNLINWLINSNKNIIYSGKSSLAFTKKSSLLGTDEQLINNLDTDKSPNSPLELLF